MTFGAARTRWTELCGGSAPGYRLRVIGAYAWRPGELAVAVHGVRAVARANALQNGLGPAGRYANLRQPRYWDDRIAVAMALPCGGAIARARAAPARRQFLVPVCCATRLRYSLDNLNSGPRR